MIQWLMIAAICVLAVGALFYQLRSAAEYKGEQNVINSLNSATAKNRKKRDEINASPITVDAALASLRKRSSGSDK